MRSTNQGCRNVQNWATEADTAIINLVSPRAEEADGTVKIKASQEEVGP